jgi:PAS domain-containing protein
LTLHRHGYPEQVWLDLDFSPITDLDDVVVGVLGIVVETTEKYQANKILTLDRERLRTMFDQAPGFMALLSGPEHVYEMVNQAYLSLVGQRSVLGKTRRQSQKQLSRASLQSSIRFTRAAWRSRRLRPQSCWMMLKASRDNAISIPVSL